MRLIDADDLMNKYERIDWYSVSEKGGLMRGATSEDNPVIHYYDGEEVIRNAPTIEAEPVRHGRWIEHQHYHHDHYIDSTYECSECNVVEPLTSDYCPNCGCKMDKEE